jgi:hypothetical protein
MPPGCTARVASLKGVTGRVVPNITRTSALLDPTPARLPAAAWLRFTPSIRNKVVLNLPSVSMDTTLPVSGTLTKTILPAFVVAHGGRNLESCYIIYRNSNGTGHRNRQFQIGKTSDSLVMDIHPHRSNFNSSDPAAEGQLPRCPGVK